MKIRTSLRRFVKFKCWKECYSLNNFSRILGFGEYYLSSAFKRYKITDEDEEKILSYYGLEEPIIELNTAIEKLQWYMIKNKITYRQLAIKSKIAFGTLTNYRSRCFLTISEKNAKKIQRATNGFVKVEEWNITNNTNKKRWN